MRPERKLRPRIYLSRWVGPGGGEIAEAHLHNRTVIARGTGPTLAAALRTLADELDVAEAEPKVRALRA
jgi:hypothetical protein